MDGLSVEVELESGLEALNQARLETSTHEGLIHIEHEDLVFGLLSQFKTLHVKICRVVIIAFFVGLVELVTESEQIN